MKRYVSTLVAIMTFVTATLAYGVSFAAGKPYVVIIANNHSHDPGVKSLQYADDDATRYYELFSLVTDRVALFTVLDNETARLHPKIAAIAKPPVASDIFATLARWNAEMASAKLAGKKSELVFIYAGHGDVDKTGEGYVNLQKTRLRRRDLFQKVLAPSQASYLHLIIDACKSYFLVNRRGGWKDDSVPNTHAAEISAFLKKENLTAYPNAGVILATSGSQSTHEWTRYRGGILSHELRSALAGAADINGDGRIEYSEIHAFIAAANARVKHPEARLNIFARAPQANRHRPLFDLRQASGARLIRFDKRLAGRYHLEDDRGLRLADLNKAAGTRFDLAVNRQHTIYVRRSSDEARVPPGKRRILVASLSFSRSRMAARSASLDKTFRRDLYRVPFSRGFYDGFVAQAGHVAVAGGSEDFTIARPAERRSHYLSVGYLASGALLDLGELNHGLQLGYRYRLGSLFSIGGIVQYGASGHTPGNTDFALHRIAAMANANLELDLSQRFAVRAEAAVGYQGYFIGGDEALIEGVRISGSDPAGLRSELGAGVRISLSNSLAVNLRGGLALELVTVEPDEKLHVTGYFGLGFELAP
jgi:hypothetical protein